MQQTVSTVQDFRWRQRSHHYLPESLPTAASQTLTHFIRSFHETTARHLTLTEQLVSCVSRGPERKVDMPLVTLGSPGWEACSRQRRVIIHAPPTKAAGPDATCLTPVSLPRPAPQSREADVRAWLQDTCEPLSAPADDPLPLQKRQPKPPQADWKSWSRETALAWLRDRAKAVRVKPRKPKQRLKITWHALSTLRGGAHRIISAKTLSAIARYHGITLHDL